MIRLVDVTVSERYARSVVKKNRRFYIVETRRIRSSMNLPGYGGKYIGTEERIRG